jgi:hypothetical protein
MDICWILKESAVGARRIGARVEYPNRHSSIQGSGICGDIPARTDLQ